jgi:hypothetical protein
MANAKARMVKNGGIQEADTLGGVILTHIRVKILKNDDKAGINEAESGMGQITTHRGCRS